MMTKPMTTKVTADKWYPLPISEERRVGTAGIRNTSPCTCFHPYSSPRSRS